MIIDQKNGIDVLLTLLPILYDNNHIFFGITLLRKLENNTYTLPWYVVTVQGTLIEQCPHMNTAYSKNIIDHKK